MPKIKRACKAIDARPTFDGQFTVKILERALSDEQFAARRSSLILSVVRPIVKMKLHRLAAYVYLRERSR